jgi:uncharacterized protein (TIGR00369 family)
VSKFQSSDPDFESRIRESFAAQKLMQTLHAEFSKVEPGEVTIEMPYDENFTQQNGFTHAGIITSIADTACGYAAYTLMAADSGVLSVEFKVNFVAPAIGERFSARAQVLKSGRTLTVCRADVFALNAGEEKLIATMLATMIAIKGERESR